uniref:Uncharacterized protein n=1 Tax=Rhizophora mucronata TaxID=61149 RepID=A0A2P2Q1H2_RHIMU
MCMLFPNHFPLSKYQLDLLRGCVWFSFLGVLLLLSDKNRSCVW